MSGPVLSAVNVTAGYYGDTTVLNSLSLAAQPGRVTVVLGPNGSGKSTLLRVFYGLLMPRSGSILYDGQDITSVPANQRLRLGLALLPQGHSLFRELTVHENLVMGAWVLRTDRRTFQVALARAYDSFPALKALRMKIAGSLSGGQQRLVEIARLLICDPRVVLIDEPSVGLAPAIVDQVYEHLDAIKSTGKTIVLVDQNVNYAVNIADYVYILKSGTVAWEGERAGVHTDPASIVSDWLKVAQEGSK